MAHRHKPHNAYYLIWMHAFSLKVTDCLYPIDGLPCSSLQAQTSPTRVPEKKRSTSEKNFSVDVLRKYFSGSLRDAAASLGGKPLVSSQLFTLSVTVMR
jgi:hypothetical protein